MTYRTPKTVASGELVQITELGQPLRDAADLIPLITSIGNSRFVLLGEASHGTHEYYEWRAEITKRLIAQHGFSFVAVEGDWPACFAIKPRAGGAQPTHAGPARTGVDARADQ